MSRTTLNIIMKTFQQWYETKTNCPNGYGKQIKPPATPKNIKPKTA
jgi:hypothetical protein